MPEIVWEQTQKQSEAWEFLRDQITEELIFGGGAGGGKSRLGCSWLIIMCGEYPGTRWLLGRSKLKRLKETTLVTFFDVCQAWGIKKDVHFKYNEITGVITWKNGSIILMKDLFQYPSDPNFDDLGSLEITGAFIDEVNQIVFKAWVMVKSRCRYKLDMYGLIPKMLGTCNPSKGWVYLEFYLPFKKGILEIKRRFVQALARDNKFNSKTYIENLMGIKIKAIRERLLNGNWEYDDDPSSMFDYEELSDLFTNKIESKDGDQKWIIADVSRKGVDNFPVFFWDGWQVKEIVVLPYEIRKDIKKASEWLINYAVKKGVPRRNIIVDEDGVGGGVVDMVGCTGFINNAKAIQPKEFLDGDVTKKVNYANLKSQCYDMLSVKVHDATIGIDDPGDADIKASIIQDLEQIKQVDMDKDSAFRVIGKDEIKESLGRSPDYGDCMMMRMYGEIKPRVYEPGFREI